MSKFDISKNHVNNQKKINLQFAPLYRPSIVKKYSRANVLDNFNIVSVHILFDM